MKSYKLIKSLCIYLLFTAVSFAQTETNFSIMNFKLFSGIWNGTLTYLDYSSGKEVVIKAHLNVSKSEDERILLFENSFPDEPNVRWIDTVVISLDGDSISGETILSVKNITKDSIEITSTERGTDGNDKRPAVFFHSYRISQQYFVKEKRVKFDGETTEFIRHTYSYKKVK